MKMSNPNTRTKILNRIARVHAVKVEDLDKLSDADILKRYWRHIRTKDLDDLDQNEVDKCPKVFDKMSNRIRRNKRFIKMKELETSGYFELAKAKERDPGLYEAIVGRDRIGRPETMKFSDVLMRCWMQERDPDTDMRKIDQDNAQEQIVEEDEEEEEEEEDEDEERKAEEEKRKEEEAASSYINPDADDEERQFEFIEMMKQRFIDGKDPDFGLISQLYYMSHAACDMIHVKFIFVETSFDSDYVNFDKSIIYDHEDDKTKTENWFDEDSDEESPNQDVQNSLNNRNDEDEDSEDDYMKMDLSKL